MKKNLSIFTLSILFALSAAAQHLSIYTEDEGVQLQTSDGKFVSADMELVTEIQKRIGNNDQIQFVPWTRGLSYLDSDADIVLFPMARTDERNDLYQWIGPISERIFSFYTKADSNLVITSLDDAKKVALIGVYRNDVRDKFLTKQGFTNLDRAANSFSNFKKMMAGRFTMIASSPDAMRMEVKLAGYSMNDVKFLYAFMKSPIYIAVSKKTDPKIVANWNAALESMKKDGTYNSIVKKHSQEDELLPLSQTQHRP